MPLSIRRPGPSADPGPRVTDRGPHAGETASRRAGDFLTTRLGRVAQPLGRRARRYVRVTSLPDDAAAHDLLRRAGVAAAVIPEILAARPGARDRGVGAARGMAPRAGDSVVTRTLPPPASGAPATQRWLQLWAIIAAVPGASRSTRARHRRRHHLAHPRGHRHQHRPAHQRARPPRLRRRLLAVPARARADLPARSPPVQPHVHHVRPGPDAPFRVGDPARGAHPSGVAARPGGVRRLARSRRQLLRPAPPRHDVRGRHLRIVASTSNSSTWSVPTATSCASSAASPRSRAGRKRATRTSSASSSATRTRTSTRHPPHHARTGDGRAPEGRQALSQPARLAPPLNVTASGRHRLGRLQPDRLAERDCPAAGSSPSSSKRVDDNARCAAALLSPTASSASARPSTTSACARPGRRSPPPASSSRNPASTASWSPRRATTAAEASPAHSRSR